MPTILVAGSGQIGTAIGQILTQPGMNYSVILADLNLAPPQQLLLHRGLRYVPLDVSDSSKMAEVVQQYQVQAVISSLPYFLNLPVAELARSLKLHYFDLTEDVGATAEIAKLAQGADSAFVPQCGIAPGFINIVAHHLMQKFEEVDTAKLRCGALPQQANNVLQYAITWSVDGLINEYGNPCPAIVNNQILQTSPLSDLEIVQLDGASYEAFNTSGGLGTLVEQYAGKVRQLNYKTLRYPGHCEKMRFLMNDLKLNEDREVLKKILLNVIPRTFQDVVIVEVSVVGKRNGERLEENYFNKFYPSTINNQALTAIQTTTASSVCVIIDLVLNNPQKYRGFIHQTQFSLAEFLDNRFSKYFRPLISNSR